LVPLQAWSSSKFNFLVYYHTNSEVHPAFYPVSTGGPLPGGKVWPGRDADHSLPSSADVKNE
jgi:hypothetical protein